MQNARVAFKRNEHYNAALVDDTDVHTPAKQMGTSERSLEQHYSKLTAISAAGKLAELQQ
jgi:hypothetical protein